jgi:TPR repeat protein
MNTRALRALGLPAIALALMLAAASVAAQDRPPADPFQEGVRAYSNRNFARAIHLWGPLAQRGDGSAQFNIGRMYARGEGVQRNLPEAYKWFTLASLAGRPEGERARQAISRNMTPVQMADGLRRAEAWRQQRR